MILAFVTVLEKTGANVTIFCEMILRKLPGFLSTVLPHMNASFARINVVQVRFKGKKRLSHFFSQIELFSYSLCCAY